MTVYVPAEPEQDSVDAPEVPSITPVGVKVHARPVDGDTAAVMATLPVKPWRAVAVMIEVPATPALTVTVVGEAVSVKSLTT